MKNLKKVHYEKSIALFGDLIVATVFQSLLDKCQDQEIQAGNGIMGPIKISRQGIQKEIFVDRHTISKALETLQRIRVISLNEDNRCRIDYGFYKLGIAAIQCAEYEEQDFVRDLFFSGNKKMLEAFITDKNKKSEHTMVLHFWM